MSDTTRHWSGWNEISTLLSEFTVEIDPSNRRVRLSHGTMTIDYPEQALVTTSLNRLVADALRHIIEAMGGMPLWGSNFIEYQHHK